MAKPLFVTDLKINFKARDFILDFLACLVPGLVFLISITLIIGSLFLIILSYELFLNEPQLNLNITVFYSEVFNSFSFQFWLTLSIIFLAYFCGHLLYRQTPKTPDYASFLRIRYRVIRKKNDWVIEQGRGVISDEVQFPYSNLKNYLSMRGFGELSKMIEWGENITQDNVLGQDKNDTFKSINIQRSKTFINKMKIRLSTYYPEHSLNMIRNEAHIRLASSMWYASKYIIQVSYVTVPFILVLLLLIIFNTLSVDFLKEDIFNHKNLYFFQPITVTWLIIICSISFVISVIFWIIGINCKNKAKLIISEWRENTTKRNLIDENNAKIKAHKIDRLFVWYDRCPNISAFASLFAYMSFLVLYSRTYGYSTDIAFFAKAIFIYNVFHVFILLGAIFGKHRIEETIHYQRVREVFYVLETVFLSKLYKKFVPDLKSFKE